VTAELLDGLARHLAALDLVVYDPSGAVQTDDWSLFIDHMPPGPDLAVALTAYTGGDSDPLGAWEDTPVQVRVRGTADPHVSRVRADQLHGELHGLGPLTLPGGVWLQLSLARGGGPASMGPDANGRHEHVTNLTVTWAHPTAHRPAP
jgi:hypothetical protein